MRKSITGAVLGLIGGIILTIMGLTFTLSTSLVLDVVGEGLGLVVILSWAMFLGGILGIIGASLCFKKARVGGILLLGSFVLTIGYVVNYFAKLAELGSTGAETTFITLGAFMAIPCILVLVGGILGVVAKIRQPQIAENK